MVTAPTLPREPWRGSMICGWQIAYGMPQDAFCARRKADGAPLCQEHWDELPATGELYWCAPGNALGAPQWAMRLLWEPEDGGDPIEASAEEVARYAGILDHMRGE